MCRHPLLVFIEHWGYAFGVSNRTGKLPGDWDKPIPDALWPETLISAVRHDVRALASPRVLATLRQWQAALTTGELATQREAQRRLRAVGDALFGVASLPNDPVADASESFTVDAFQRPTPANPAGSGADGIELPDELDATDARFEQPELEPTANIPPTGHVVAARPGKRRPMKG